MMNFPASGNRPQPNPTSTNSHSTSTPFQTTTPRSKNCFDDGDDDDDVSTPARVNSAPVLQTGPITFSSIVQHADNTRVKDQLRKNEIDVSGLVQRMITASVSSPAPTIPNTNSNPSKPRDEEQLLQLQQLLPKIAHQDNARLGDPSSLPDEPDFQDYATHSIETIGWSMLFGQDYVPGEGIGVTNKAETAPIDLLAQNNVRTGMKSDNGAMNLQFGDGTRGLGASSNKLTLKDLAEKDGAATSSSSSSTPSTSTSSSSLPTSSLPSQSNTQNNQHAALRQSDRLKADNQHQHQQTSRDRSRDYSNQISTPQQPLSPLPRIDDSYRRSFPKQFTWIRKGLTVKITDQKSRYYSYKGVIDRISERTNEIIVVITLSPDDPNSRYSSSKHRHIRESDRPEEVEVRIKDEQDLQTVLPKSLPKSADPSVHEPNFHQNPRVLVVAGKWRGFMGYIAQLNHSQPNNRSTQVLTVDLQLKINQDECYLVQGFSLDDVCLFSG